MAKSGRNQQNLRGGVLPAGGPSVERGGIYYIEIPSAVGHEIVKNRPGIVVSTGAVNRWSNCVTVVYCSASEKVEMPWHITVRSTPVKSTALCEHIYTVDKSRIGRCLGRVSPDEMARVDAGVLAALGMKEPDDEDDRQEEPVPEDARRELAEARAELGVYKKIYEELLGRVLAGGGK